MTAYAQYMASPSCSEPSYKFYRHYNNRPDRQATYRRSHYNIPNHSNSTSDNTKPIATSDTEAFPHITCYKCKKNDHYVNVCPERRPRASHLSESDSDQPLAFPESVLKPINADKSMKKPANESDRSVC